MSNAGKMLKRNYPTSYLGGVGNGLPVKNSYGQLIKRNTFNISYSQWSGPDTIQVQVPSVSISGHDVIFNSWKSRTLLLSDIGDDFFSDDSYGPFEYGRKYNGSPGGEPSAGEEPYLFDTHYSDSCIMEAFLRSSIGVVSHGSNTTNVLEIIRVYLIKRNFWLWTPHFGAMETPPWTDIYDGSPLLNVANTAGAQIGRWMAITEMRINAGWNLGWDGDSPPSDARTIGPSGTASDYTGIAESSIVGGGAYCVTQHRIHNGLNLQYVTSGTSNEYSSDWADGHGMGLSSALVSASSGFSFQVGVARS